MSWYEEFITQSSPPSLTDPKATSLGPTFWLLASIFIIYSIR